MNRVLILFLFISIESFAQPRPDRHFTYRQYTTYDGLAQSQVTELYQCSKGYLWVCTKEGVSRFDGKGFTNFGGDGLDQFNSVAKIFENKAHYYFLAGNTIYKYKGAMLELVHSFTLPDSFFFSPQLMTELNGDTLSLFNLKIKHSPLHTYGHLSVSLTNESSTIINIPHSRLLAHTDRKNIEYFFFNEFYLSVQPNGSSDSTFFPERYVNLWCHHRDTIYGLTKTGKNLIALHFQNDSLVETNTALQLNEGYSYLNKKSNSGNRTQQLVYFDNHFNLFSIGNGQHKKLATLSEITAILVDRENNLWVGTEDGIYNFYQQAFESYNFNVGAKTDNVWSINQDHTGTMWFSGYRVGIWTLDKHEKIKVLHPGELNLPVEASKQFRNQYMGSTRDAKGRLFFPEINNLLVFDGGKAKGIDHAPHSALFLFNDEQNNRILSLGVGGNIQISKTDWIPKKIHGETSTIVSCTELSDGNFLLGSYHHQYLYNNESITELPDTFQYKGVISMVRDSLGNIWKGTTSGLYLSSPNGEKRIGTSTIQGNIASVFLYKHLLFAGTKQHLYLIDIEEYYRHNVENIKTYDQNNGYHAMDGGQNGFFLDNDGFLWYPVLDKVIRFKPEEVEAFKAPEIPDVSIISISASNEKNQVLKINEPDSTVQLPIGYKALRFEFFASCFNAPNKVQYRWMLHGNNENWSAPTFETTVSVTNLSPDNFQFMVQSSLDGINWSAMISSVPIIVSPFWWQTWWAEVTAGLLLIFVLTFVIWFLLKARQKQVIRKLSEQKRLNELRLQSVRSKYIPHFSGNALSNIEHFIFSADIRMANKYLAKYSRLMNLTLRDADLASRSIEQELEYVSLYLELEKMRFQDKLDYAFHIDPLVDQSTRIPNMLLHTWVENAIKHGIRHLDGAGKIELRITFEHPNLHIAVTDNGIGREKAKYLATSGSGNGLKILAEQINIYNHFNTLKAKLLIKDLTKQDGFISGTCFELVLPKGFKFEN